MQNKGKYPCPVCKSISYIRKYSYQICPVCGWQDDESETICPDVKEANRYSFNEYKRRWENGETIYPEYPNPKAV